MNCIEILMKVAEMVDKDQVIAVLRATLLSCKGALTIKQCNRDYRELQGEWIPYQKLGYTSLEKLFLDVPGFKVNNVNGEWMVDAIASQETQHIANLVARQKSSYKKPAPRFQSRLPKNYNSWRKPETVNHSNYNNKFYKQNYTYSKRPFTNFQKPITQYDNTRSSFHSDTTRASFKKSSPDKYETKSSQQNVPTTTSNSVNNSSAPVSAPATVKSVKPTTDSKPQPAIKKPATNSAVPTAPLRRPAAGTASERLQACAELAAQLNLEDNTPPALTKTPENNVSNDKIEIKNVSKPAPAKMTASQRLSNFRDKLNTVDVIPLPLPAITHENVLPRKPTELEPVEGATPQQKLLWTCRRLGLPEPMYKVVSHKQKGGPHSFDCTVQVGSNYKASSYPESAPSEELARAVAALKLLPALEQSGAALPLTPAPLAEQRLVDLVAQHHAGIWANNVLHLYRERYNEDLPANWQSLIESNPRIITDRVANGLVVLLPRNELEELNVVCGGEPTVPSELPALQFPEAGVWNVYVTVANSAIEVWLRIIGEDYSDAYEELLASMNAFYSSEGKPALTVSENCWYAVMLEECGWQRAKVLEVEDGSCTVFLGDHGDDDHVPISHLRLLEPQFRILPAQAILCRLEGCEELGASGNLGAEVVQRRLLDQVLVAEPIASPDPNEPTVSVVLYDTSTAVDLNLNDEIIKDFCKTGELNLTPRPTEVEVWCATEEGHLWVGRAGGARLVRDALALLTAPGSPYRRPLPHAPRAPPPPTHPPHLYIVCTMSGDWVRCTIRGEMDAEGTVWTRLVDSGQRMRAPLSSLVPLANYSKALNGFPYQAKEVVLGGCEEAARALHQRLRALVAGERVLCRALPSALPPAPRQPHGAPPAPPRVTHVELFVRTTPGNILASVNNALRVEYEMMSAPPIKEKVESELAGESGSGAVEALQKKKERIFRAASGGGSAGSGLGSPAPPGCCPALPAPPLPAVGQCFDVFIAMAANPWNFVVQPNSSRSRLQEMMSTLQAECPNLSAADAPKNIQIGDLYTIFYDKDKSWYRVVVAGLVSSTMVSVYFCDFGDLALVGASELRPVPPAAPLAASLHPQAIKARLHDVAPLHQDWTVEDCIRFQSLCVDQQFVGICTDVTRDPINPNEPLLTLDLIDTSTEEDIYLNKLLVSEGRAKMSSTE